MSIYKYNHLDKAGIVYPTDHLPGLKNLITTFVESIPDEEMFGLLESSRTLFKDRNLRMDMQNVCHQMIITFVMLVSFILQIASLNQFNVQPQINRGAKKNPKKIAARKSDLQNTTVAAILISIRREHTGKEAGDGLVKSS